MREYKLKISGGSNLVIVSPKVIEALIRKVHDTPEKEIAIVVEKIMPESYTTYMVNVINSNRYTNECFRFREIIDDPITNQHIYKILQGQLEQMNVNDTMCFEHIELETINGEAGMNMECSEPFFWACKDSTAKFVYTYGNGEQERIVVEY